MVNKTSVSDFGLGGGAAEPEEPPRVPLKVEEALAALAMGLICIISFGNVVVRYFTNFSFAFTEEYSVFLLVFMTFVGASLAFATNGHIRITYFTGKMSRPWRLGAEAISMVATTVMFSLIIYYGAILAFEEYRWGETSPGLGHPRWLYTIWVPILSVAILLRVFGYTIRMVRSGR